MKATRIFYGTVLP